MYNIEEFDQQKTKILKYVKAYLAQKCKNLNLCKHILHKNIKM